MLHLPYGRGTLPFDEKNAVVLRSRVAQLKSDRAGLCIVEDAMTHPIGTEPLAALSRGKKTCTIIISDHTRPVPSRDILPPMLRQLREGNPDIDITLLVATGFHRGTTQEELRAKLGDEILGRERIVIHDCRDAAANVAIGTLPSGAPCVIDRTAAETDLLVAEGFIEPHFFAGFSGGRKSVLPGVCDQVTVLGNHCSRFIDSEFARTGVLEGNPLHRDMLAAARMAKLAFIVNVVIDAEKRTVAAFAGDMEQAHAAGCAFLRQYCEVKAAPADIVVTTNGGAPLDQNVYQCVKGLTAAEASAKKGAVLVMCAALSDGHGGEGFYETLKNCVHPAELYDRIMATVQDKTVPDQWESQILARILMQHRVIFVAPAENRRLLEDMKLGWAADLPAAMAMARAEKGQNAAVTVIPDGVSVIVKQ